MRQGSWQELDGQRRGPAAGFKGTLSLSVSGGLGPFKLKEGDLRVKGGYESTYPDPRLRRALLAARDVPIRTRQADDCRGTGAPPFCAAGRDLPLDVGPRKSLTSNSELEASVVALVTASAI